MASWLGGGTVKHTEGTMASFPLGLITFHLVLWELSSNTHSSPRDIVICGERGTGERHRETQRGKRGGEGREEGIEKLEKKRGRSEEMGEKRWGRQDVDGWAGHMEEGGGEVEGQKWVVGGEKNRRERKNRRKNNKLV